MVVAMIAVGERTGRLEEMLNRVADFYDDEVEVAVANLSALLEPILMILLGFVVGGLVVSMYLPIFQMPGLVGG
jgi:type IV pilus assembly protein PilC